MIGRLHEPRRCGAGQPIDPDPMRLRHRDHQRHVGMDEPPLPQWAMLRGRHGGDRRLQSGCGGIMHARHENHGRPRRRGMQPLVERVGAK